MQKQLIYQMYPRVWRGFQEMAQHLRWLKDLGVDYVWLSPFYPSGGVDGGYDVTDYRAVDPAIGTMVEFDRFVQEAEALGIKVLLDLVLNHTSTKHPWFRMSRDRQSPWDEYYLWSHKDLGWNNLFDGGSAFKYDEEVDGYYLHLFHETQADLNWTCPQVRDEFTKIIDFWTREHGVAGFRLDVPILISKNLSSTWWPRSWGKFAGLSHYYMRRGVLEILHDLFDGRDLFLIAESGAPFNWVFNRLFAESDSVVTGAFNTFLPSYFDKSLGLFMNGRNYARFERVLKRWSKNPHFVAAVESHDLPRFTSYSGRSGKEIIYSLARANPRMICLYQGQELGLENPELSLDIKQYQDIQTIMRYHRDAHGSLEEVRAVMHRLRFESRDNARQPLDLSKWVCQSKSEDSCYTFAKDTLRLWKGIS